MWFLKGRPTNIKVRALVASINGGYQQTNYRFSVESNEKVWIALAVPWAPHKPNGSFKITNEDQLSSLVAEDTLPSPTVLTDVDIEVWERLRDLKTQDNIELIHVQELINWYLDDIGVITFWVEPGKTYQLNYTHKIASDSCLFLPTRLPTIIAARKPDMDYKLWVVDGVTLEVQKWLKRETVEGLSRNMKLLSFREWGWDEDTRINTDNWESSDDDYESSDSE